MANTNAYNKIEIWKDINGYEGIYQISSFGNIRKISVKNSIGRKSSPQPIKTQQVKDGKYRGVLLSKNGRKNNFLVHKLVAIAFLDGPDRCPACNSNYEINHKDLNGCNNSSDNLEYVTRKENTEHAKSKHQKSVIKLLSAEKVTIIKQLISLGVSYPKIAKQFGVSKSTISDISNGRLWTHVSNISTIKK